MNRRLFAIAVACSAVLKVQVYVGSPHGVIFLVEMDYVAVPREERFFGLFRNHPAVVGVCVVVAQLVAVHDDGELVPAAALVHLRQYLEKAPPVIGNDDIVCFEFDGVGLPPIYRVFEVSASLDFPAVVNL